MQQRQPAGYKFEPTDQELVGYYLPKKVRDEKLANDFVQKCDVYGAEEPWLIFDKSVNKVFYVFTKLKKKSKLMVQRTAGCGTWAGQNIEEVRTGHGGDVIGLKRSFTFEVKEKDKWKAEGNGHWIMHEFSMGRRDDQEVVLCRIRNKDVDQKADEEEVTRSEFEAILNALNLGAAGGRDSKKRKARTLSPGEENCGHPKSLRLCNMAEREQPHSHDEPMYYKGCAQGSYHDNQQQQQAAVNRSPQSYLSIGSRNQPYSIAKNQANYPVEEISCEQFAEINYDYDQLLAALQEFDPSQAQGFSLQEYPSIGSCNQLYDIANTASHNLPTAEQNTYREYADADLNTNQQQRATVFDQSNAAAIMPQAYSSMGLTSTGELYDANIGTYSLGEFASTSHALQSYVTGPNPSVMETLYDAGYQLPVIR